MFRKNQNGRCAWSIVTKEPSVGSEVSEVEWVRSHMALQAETNKGHGFISRVICGAIQDF